MNAKDLNCTLMFRERINFVHLINFATICEELTPKTWARLIDKDRVYDVFRQRTESTPIVLAWKDKQTFVKQEVHKGYALIIDENTNIIYYIGDHFFARDRIICLTYDQFLDNFFEFAL